MRHRGTAWLAFFIINAILLVYFSFFAYIEPAGDVAEYYGVTESIKNHLSIHLTPEDQSNLKESLHSAYYEDPQYYLQGRSGLRYPVHFFFYSMLATPVRLMLEVGGGIAVNALAVTNVIILAFTVSYFLISFRRAPTHQESSQKNFLQIFTSKPIFFLILIYLSPFLWFLAWPGPDVFYMCMLLLAFLFISKKKYYIALFFSILASWHSQPLIIIALGISAFIIAFGKISRQVIYSLLFLGILAVIPYLYNYYFFGALTPWMLFENGWTQLNGFGIHNIQFKKLFEQIFDLNVGLFWYMPLLIVIVGYIFKNLQEKKPLLFPMAVVLTTALMYQTNPAWHYGTSGYGPTRHILFMVPLLIMIIMYFYTYFRERTKKIFIVSFALSQLVILSYVGFVAPDFQKSLYHTPLARLILNVAPSLYNPTPEIFVDRTNHEDLDRPSTALYTFNGSCKKAFVLLNDKDIIEDKCGAIPSKYASLFDNEYARRANYPRNITTTEVFLYPDPDSCQDDAVNSEFKCIRSRDEFMEKSGVNDIGLVQPLENSEEVGAWQIVSSLPIDIIIPAGYTADFILFEGVYVNF